MNGGSTSAVFRAWLGRLTGPQRALFAAAAVLLTGNVWLVATWGREVSEARATLPMPPMPPEVAAEEIPGTPLEYDAMVERNLFAPDRRPPAAPWSESSGEAGGAPGSPATPAGPPPWTSYRLHGTVLTGIPGRSFALIEADPSRPGPERYRVGERVGGYRLREILATRVVLSGGAVLELKPAEPAPPPAAGGPE